MDGGPGRLIAITSAQGADRGAARQAAYSAAKSGIVRLVEAVSAEFKSQGVGAYALAPSTILFGDEDDTKGVLAEHIAELCLSLCTPAALSMTGSVVRADGA
jgi:NAD(P)-dependent dehydrogenase (short-subunit alcohol dehydrogenase family)